MLELCSGLGALGQGAVAAGFQVLAACDFRQKMCELYQKNSSAKVVEGHICTFETLLQLAEVFPASGMIASGISCQPYSYLGDGRSGMDPRSSSLPATLSIAYLLRAMVVVIECVGPAQNDPFVNHHINNFCSKTKFHRSDCLLELQDVWPSRRGRWWCILFAPAIGKIALGSCKELIVLHTVEHVLPSIRKWPRCEEEELKLSPIELEAFRDSDRQHGKYLLNKKGPMPCALHCWGSQLIACPCGCRNHGLSETRLKTRGLFGVLVESSLLKVVRHLHPQEAAALCGLDPILHWGQGARLALGAVGQLASPIQSLWIFAHILKVLQKVQWQASSVDPKLMLMAYRAWILTRCRLLFCDLVSFPASETLALSERFEPVRAFSMVKLLQVFKDPEKFPKKPENFGNFHGQGTDVTIQTVWEACGTAPTECIESSIASSVVPSEDTFAHSVPPTSVVSSEDESGEVSHDHGLTVSQIAIDEVDVPGNWDQVPFEIVLTSDDGPPVPITVSCRSTVDNLQRAERGLRREKRKACTLFEDGKEITQRHQLLQPGSIYYGDFSRDASDSETSLCPEAMSELSMLPAESKPEVPVEDKSQPDLHSNETVSEDQPLTSLVGPNFLCIHPPIVGTLDQCACLLAQRCDIQVRLKALENQGTVWGDDEKRWHLARIQHEAGSSCPLIPIDPILMHGTLSTASFKAVAQFVQHSHIREAVYISVINQQHHWYPIILQCKGSVLQVTTWDHPEAGHAGLLSFCQSFADYLGLHLDPIHQIERRFCGSSFCGSLSIAFLEHRILGAGLPETSSPAEAHHLFLRKLYREALAAATTTWQPWIWGNGVSDPQSEDAVQSLTPLLIAHGVPSDHAHHRAKQAVKAIGSSQVVQALQGKAPWKSLKTLGNNVKFRFITEEELQTQIANRSGQGQVGKPKPKSKHISEPKQTEVTLYPSKLELPEGTFTAGGKSLVQIPLSMIGPLSEGVAVVTWQQAEPCLRSSQIVAKGPLALLVLQGPTGGCQTSLQTTKVTAPARCTANQEPILLEAILVQLGSITVSKSIAQAPVSIETVQVATIKVAAFRDECKIEWEQFCGAPLKYILQQLPLLRLCKSTGCPCPCWHNSEEINVSDAIIDVWRRQFLRAGYKPEPPASSTIFTVCLRIPSCLLGRLLASSSEGGIYVEPRSMDSKDVHPDYEVVWIPKSDKAGLCHLRQTNPAAIGIVRIGDRYGLRVKSTQAADLHKSVRPDAVYLSTGVRQHYLVGPIPYGTDRKALCKALLQMPWEVKPLQPIAALYGQRGVMWNVLAVSEPPTNIINMSHGEVLITKQKESQTPKEASMKPVATPSTISLCGSGHAPQNADPWSKVDPWSSYTGPRLGESHAAAMTAATESLHQLENKIEQAVLSKIPQCVAMDQDDIPDRLQDLESKFQTLLSRQQKLEGVVTEQSVQQAAQLGQMQAQLNAQGQQISGQMEAQQLQIQGMFDAQMSQIRSLLAKRPRDDTDGHE